MEYQTSSEQVSALRLHLSRLQQGVGSLLQIQISALQPGSIAERRSTVIFSDVLQSAGGQLGIAHYFLGYYKKELRTDKMAGPYLETIKSLADVKPATDRETEYHAIMKTGINEDSTVVLTKNYALEGYFKANRFEKIQFLRNEVQTVIDKITKLPYTRNIDGFELERVYLEHAVSNLTLGKALLGEHYQELLEIQKSGNAVEIID